MRYFHCLILILFSWKSIAQNTSWQQISIADGLSQGMVYDMMQDREGFMWVATKDGLNRYDGYNFKIFTNDPYNENSISGNTCTALFEDGDRIWIGTEIDGLNLFDKKTQKFYHANIKDAALKNAGNYGITHIRIDKAGNILIFTYVTNKIFIIRKLEDLPLQADFSKCVESLNAKEILKYVPPIAHGFHLNFGESQILFQANYPTLFTSEFLSQAENISYQKDKDERLWVITTDKLYCNKGLFQKVIDIPKSNDVCYFDELEDGTLAISNREYLWLFQPNELLKLEHLTIQNAFIKLPPNCRQFMKDNRGNIWAGTRGYGLMKFNSRIKQFQSYVATYSPSMLFKDAQGRIYFHGNYNPAYLYYELNATINSFKPITPALTIKPWGLGHDFLYQDQDNNFWLLCNVRTGIASVDASYERFLIKYTKDWVLLKQFKFPDAEKNNNQSVKIIPVQNDKNGSFLIGLVNGKVLRFNPKTEQFETFSYQHLIPQNGTTVATYAMHQDHEGTLWIGTQKGLIKIKNLAIKSTYSIFKNSKTDRKSLSNDFVSGIVNDPLASDKYLWISTKGGGLERFDKQNSTFEHFTLAQGLPNNVVYGVLEGDDKNLWLSTNRGIARLNPKTLIFTNFNKSDGLQDDEFNTNSYFKATTGELFFGGVNGFNVFRPSQIGGRGNEPTVKIIGLKVNNKSVEVGDENQILENAIEYLPKMDLSHNQNLITLEFSVMDFTNPIKNRFRYQLAGIDDDWVEAGTNRFANYAQLPSGSYTFKVMGTTDGEHWSKVSEMKIRINSPFYRTWWAFLLYFSLLTFIVYRWYQYQLNQVRLQEQILYKDKETERLAELDAIKTRFFTNISHEFRTPLTLLVGPIESMLTKYPKENFLPLMQRNAHRLLNLINQLLDLGKLESKEMQLNLETGDLPKFINILSSSFSSLAESKQIKFEVNIKPKAFLASFDADKIEKIATNLLSNAFKFTPKNGTISLDFSIQNSEAFLCVKDSGIGISADKILRIFDRFYQAESGNQRNFEGTGIGLALVEELVKLMKGEVWAESKEVGGSAFFVKIPTEKADNKAVMQNIEPKVLFVENKTKLNPPYRAVQRLAGHGGVFQDSLPSILIVEDNADLRSYIRSIFETNYQVIEAFDGQDGLEKAIEFMPALLISDLMMPRMDGFGLCKTLKSDEKTSHIPVVMLTAKAEVENRIEGFGLGADEYLVKPFNVNEIVARVRNLLEKQARLQAFFSKYIVELKPDTKKTLSIEDSFLLKIKKITEENLADSAFGVEQFSREIGMSQSQLLRKMKAISNKTVVEFLKDYRLERAANLISQHTGTLAEIAFQVGYESPSYFTKSFHEKFGVLPSEYQG